MDGYFCGYYRLHPLLSPALLCLSSTDYLIAGLCLEPHLVVSLHLLVQGLHGRQH